MNFDKHDKNFTGILIHSYVVGLIIRVTAFELSTDKLSDVIIRGTGQVIHVTTPSSLSTGWQEVIVEIWTVDEGVPYIFNVE